MDAIKTHNVRVAVDLAWQSYHFEATSGAALWTSRRPRTRHSSPRRISCLNFLSPSRHAIPSLASENQSQHNPAKTSRAKLRARKCYFCVHQRGHEKNKLKTCIPPELYLCLFFTCKIFSFEKNVCAMLSKWILCVLILEVFVVN